MGTVLYHNRQFGPDMHRLAGLLPKEGDFLRGLNIVLSRSDLEDERFESICQVLMDALLGGTRDHGHNDTEVAALEVLVGVAKSSWATGQRINWIIDSLGWIPFVGPTNLAGGHPTLIGPSVVNALRQIAVATERDEVREKIQGWLSQLAKSSPVPEVAQAARDAVLAVDNVAVMASIG